MFQSLYPSSVCDLVLSLPCRFLIRDTAFSGLEITVDSFFFFGAFQLSGNILPTFQLFFFSSFSFISWKILIVSRGLTESDTTE